MNDDDIPEELLPDREGLRERILAGAHDALVSGLRYLAATDDPPRAGRYDDPGEWYADAHTWALAQFRRDAQELVDAAEDLYWILDEYPEFGAIHSNERPDFRERMINATDRVLEAVEGFERARETVLAIEHCITSIAGRKRS